MRFILTYMFNSWGLPESNQELIMAHGGISLLSLKATQTEDPQTLRMVAGAIANLCGNGKQQSFKSISCGSELPILTRFKLLMMRKKHLVPLLPSSME